MKCAESSASCTRPGLPLSSEAGSTTDLVSSSVFPAKGMQHLPALITAAQQAPACVLCPPASALMHPMRVAA